MRYFATLGPRTHDAATLKKMFQAGMSGIRLNLSHGDIANAEAWLSSYQQAARACGVDPLLLVDLNGPELRIGKLAFELDLQPGDCFYLEEKENEIPGLFFDTLEVSDEVLADDGKILLLTKENHDHKARFECLRGGVLANKKSLKIVDKELDLPALSLRDLSNMDQFRKYRVTGVMLPFVRSVADLKILKAELKKRNLEDVEIYAKVESLSGVAQLEDFLDVADEIVIARGDLGNAVPLWELPRLQKEIAAVCRKRNCRFMVVTQMLESMISHPVPTRAEVSDIFNAVLDGASSLMVTGETAVGNYPVAVMEYLVKTAEAALNYLK